MDDATELAARLERINSLTERLLREQMNSAESRRLAEQISQEINAARKALKPLET